MAAGGARANNGPSMLVGPSPEAASGVQQPYHGELADTLNDRVSSTRKATEIVQHRGTVATHPSHEPVNYVAASVNDNEASPQRAPVDDDDFWG